jgi:tRNA A37 N6-isopentenylltransferase MiaA
VEDGVLEEVQALLDRGYGADAPGMTGTGYRELARHLAGDITLDEALALVERSTRRYARRQKTWFRNQLPRGPGGALVLDGTASTAEQLRAVLEAWRRATSEEEVE